MGARSVVVSRELLFRHIDSSNFLRKAYELLMSDPEVSVLLYMSNVFAVKRLRYNDHGPVHAQIVAGAALELFDRLVERGLEPTSLRDGTAESLEEAKLIVLYGALLHDIGNAVHRDMHERFGALLAKDILDRVLPKLCPEPGKAVVLRQEILHVIYSTAYDLDCLSMEAGVVKIADGLDMAEGRARIPYRLGKVDIHAVSALSIKRVEIRDGFERPINVTVHMDEAAGIFQIEMVLLPKLKRSGPVGDYIEVYAIIRGSNPRKLYPS